MKTGKVDATNLPVLKDQVKALRVPDIKVAFGFLLDLICSGEKPGFENARKLFPAVWKRASIDVRKIAGLRYHKLYVDKDADKSKDKDGKTRPLEVLIDVEGVELIPDASRAALYRQAAKQLAAAKDASYRTCGVYSSVQI